MANDPTSVEVKRQPRVWLHVVLFLMTFATTTAAGALQNGVDNLLSLSQILSGLPFAITLMVILSVHEMGHFLMSRYHGVNATLPYFIPAPSFIGTFGAFIKMQSSLPDRRSLFDVGAAGPLAGFALAIPAVVIGLRLSTVSQDQTAGGGIALGSSILLSFLSQVTLGLLPDEANIVIHPIGFAGWIGLLVTAMNLLPIGQLDGGHVTYALFGHKALWISRLSLAFILALGFLHLWNGWLIWGFFLLLMGVRHPTPLDPDTPLDLKRTIIAWLTLVVLALTFIPVPFSIHEPTLLKEQLTPTSLAPPVEATIPGGPV